MHRHQSRSIARLVGVAAAAALTAAPAAEIGQQPSPPPQQRPTFKVEANYVRVDVYPTRSGAPVLDLRAEDFELLEDGAPQKIQAFEHVVVRGIGLGTERAEPNTIAQANQLASDARNRVFVLFLDASHVTMAGSWNMREPIIRLIDRLLGPDDLIGIMTPAMTALDLTLARKTAVIEGGLQGVWPWGERFTFERDERERMYERCYPPLPNEIGTGAGTTSNLVRQMINRRRERRTLDAMRELVLHLRDIREERKAIITISEGWVLYRPDRSLTTLRTDGAGNEEPPPGPPPIVVGPGGKLTTLDPRNPISGELYQCNADRMELASIDNDTYFRQILGEANRANASFYTVDPRGLPVFDAPIGPAPPPPPAVDMAALRVRQDTLRTLADNTDGIAVLNSNDIDAGLRRISEDLSSYYLLGYYSTNTKLDGRFRSLKVRVKRPGVDVRARRGYRAATAEEVASARTAAAAPVPEIVSTVASAIGTLDRVRTDGRLHVHAIAARPNPGERVIVWVAGELPAVSAGTTLVQGTTATIVVTAGSAEAKSEVTLQAGQRAFLAPLELLPGTAATAAVTVRLSGTPAPRESADARTQVSLAAAPSEPLLFRRGPATGNRLQPVATFQFTRSDRLRLELPAAPELTPGNARLLGKTAQPIAVPVTVGTRVDDQTGQRWITADLVLAPLAMGDYAIELSVKGSQGEQRIVTPFRITR